MIKWKIHYYQGLSGKYPVYEFIEKLPDKTQAKVYNTFELLSEFGTRLGLPHVKKMKNTPLWEVRVLGQNSLRFSYIAKLDRSFLLLHAFIKKSQNTPKKEIKTALKRLQHYKSKN